MEDSLKLLHVEKWPELKKAFKMDGRRGRGGYYSIDTQLKWLKKGYDYGFKVYCPYGDIWNGMVGINEKNGLYEVIILCPRDDTEKLEEALRTTKVINWRRPVMVPFVEDNIVKCIDRIKDDVGVELKHIITSLFHVLDKDTPLFEDVSIPPGMTFKLLTEDLVSIVNEKWPHKYPGSEWYFHHLIKTKNGYGLYQDDNLVAWMFLNEMGALAHLFVLEEYRRRGFGEYLTKIMSNKVLENGRAVLAYAVKENEKANKLYCKLGFKVSHVVYWYFLNHKHSIL